MLQMISNKECKYCKTNFTTTSSLMEHITDNRPQSVGHTILFLEPNSKPIKKKTSPVWNFAEKFDGFVKCNTCQKIVPVHNGSTTSILNHVKDKHPEEIEKYNRTVARTPQPILV